MAVEDLDTTARRDDVPAPAGPDGAPDHDHPVDRLALRSLIVQMAVGLVGLLVVVAVLATVLRDPLTAASEAFVDSFGLVGVGLGVLVVDTFMLTHEPFLFAAHAGGLAFWPTFLTASGASILAGVAGWLLGGLLGRLPIVQRVFERYRMATFLHRYGFWAIAVAALTPFPYSVATWASGAAGVPLRVVLIGSLFRAPKVMFYFLLIIIGWDVSAVVGP